MTAPLTRRLVLAAGLAIATTASLPALAGKDPIYSDGGAAASGYDVVAYFTESRPVQGSAAHTAEYQGATWRFASAANRDAFEADPARYAPQYGGYCAYAVSQGYTAKTEPDAWKIVDDKLYLNYNRSVQKRWEGNQSNFITEANANWPKVLN